jgi:hypothetical protein
MWLDALDGTPGECRSHFRDILAIPLSRPGRWQDISPAAMLARGAVRRKRLVSQLFPP